MITGLVFRIRRLWWRRFHPFVRIGTLVASKRSDDRPNLGWIGLLLVAAGLAIGKSRRTRLYGSTINHDGEIRVKVIKNGRTVASG